MRISSLYLVASFDEKPHDWVKTLDFQTYSNVALQGFLQVSRFWYIITGKVTHRITLHSVQPS